MMMVTETVRVSAGSFLISAYHMWRTVKRFCKLGEYVGVCLDSFSDLLLPVSYFSSFHSQNVCLRTLLPMLFHLQKRLDFGADDSCTR